MENNKKNFWKGALAGALAMFMVGAAALGIMNVAGVDLGTSQEKVVNAQEEKKLNKLKKLIDENYLYTDDLKEEDLENGLYSGYINALGDPYLYIMMKNRPDPCRNQLRESIRESELFFHRIRKLR